MITPGHSINNAGDSDQPQGRARFSGRSEKADAMSRAVEAVAKAYVDGEKVTEGALNRIEAAIRAYDPCLSCSRLTAVQDQAEQKNGMPHSHLFCDKALRVHVRSCGVQ